MVASNASLANARRFRRILWWGQVLFVLIVSALAWWLPDLMATHSVPGVQSTLFLIGVGAVPLIFIIGSRLKGDSETAGSQGRQRGGRGTDSGSSVPAPGRYVAILVMAELPAILALVYVLLGGLPMQALMLSVGSFVLLFLFPPG